jgi:chromosome segregation ATPase
MKNKQIEQLTKELDKDKSKYLRLAKKHKKDLKQLQAEKQKVKEMREGIEEVTDLAHGRGFINPSWMFKHLKKLLNQ